MGSFFFCGQYRRGAGHASKVFLTQRRKTFLREVFGCPMYGTFNVKVPREKRNQLRNQVKPTLEVNEGPVHWKFYLCDISNNKYTRPAWILRWSGPNKNSEGVFAELMSRELLPGEFRKDTFTVTVYEPWNSAKIVKWCPKAGTDTKFKWFQSFPWAQRSDHKPMGDSPLVWSAIKNRVEWEGKRVLDFGCHTGYFSCEAAKAGAVVTAYDKDRSVLKVARDVAHHIECRDIRFTEKYDGNGYEYILLLSVLHQKLGPSYPGLKQEIEHFRSRCKVLFLELIVGGVKGIPSEKSIDAVVGEPAFFRRKHPVRGIRKLWKLES